VEGVLWDVLPHVLNAGFKVDDALSLLPPYSLLKGIVLDSVLGPAEDFK
jgi:hypothetical protein